MLTDADIAAIRESYRQIDISDQRREVTRIEAEIMALVTALAEAKQKLADLIEASP